MKPRIEGACCGGSRNPMSFISECGQSTVHKHRIVGGTETAVNEFPWVAGIVMKNEDSEHRNKVALGSSR